jgi:hypothetical protein
LVHWLRTADGCLESCCQLLGQSEEDLHPDIPVTFSS